jgi:YegS/Rv2252/BmrU family lipid kinase
MSDVLVLANPKAGRGKAATIANHLVASLKAAGYDARREIDPDRDLPHAAITIGGDGTLRHAANKLLEAFRQIPPLVVVPFGTANLMAQHLGLKWSMDDLDRQVVAAIKAHRIRLLDCARANGELFMLIAGIGFDAEVVAALDRVRSGPISRWSYIMPALKTIWETEFSPLSVTIDGEHAFGPRPAMVFVGNVKEYGTGIPVLPDATPDDGLLDVCVLPCASHDDLLRLALHVAAGEHHDTEGAIYRKARKITVRAKKPVPVQLDGDAAGTTPLDIELLPIRVPFIVRASP